VVRGGGGQGKNHWVRMTVTDENEDTPWSVSPSRRHEPPIWIAARARGVGVVWVSILEAEVVTRTLEVPKSWELAIFAWVIRSVMRISRSLCAPAEKRDPRAATLLVR
jgi:hypothetical protein